MADIGSAYLTIFPSMDGFGAKLTSELNGINVSAIGDRLGDQIGDGISDGMGRATNGASGLSGGLSALSGAAMGVAGEIAGRLFDAVVGLGGEMVAASDSAQKFASTLSFAGIDDSTIQQLTASTQEYADRTVYDLADIRNVTAQLAANGVADYEQLAQAAGNLNAVAGGSASTFQSVAQVMTQTAGAGKLTTENWNQLTDAIPGASGALQDAMREAGAFSGNFREAMENGEISAEEFNAAVMQLGMQDVAIEAATSTSTIEGAMGNLQASVVGVGASLIDAFKPFITGGIAGIASAISQLPALFQQVAAAAAPAFQPFATALQQAGTALAPLVAQLGGAFIGLMQALSPVVQMVATYLGQWWATLVNIGAAIASTVIPILTQVIGFISGTLLPIVMPAIQSIFTAVQSTFPLIQAIITGAMSVIQAIWNAVWPVLSAVAVPIMEAVSGVVSGVMSTIQGIITAVMQAINGDWSGAWETIKSTVSSGVDGVINFVKSIPDKIMGFFSNAGSWLIDSGKAIINGLKDGITSAFDGVANAVNEGLNWIRGLFPFSPAKWGPFSGHGYTTYSGRALIEGFGEGIAQAGGSAVSAAIGAVEDVEGVFSGASAQFGTIGSASLGAYASASGEEPTADALLRSIDDGIAYIAQLLPEALDPATRARFARGAVTYAY